MDIKTKIQSGMDKSPFESKKAIGAFLTLIAVLGVYAASLVTIVVLQGRSSSDIVSLANITIVFIGTLMSIWLTGQSAIDWKATSALENINKTEIENKTLTQEIDIDTSTKIDEKYTEDINLKQYVREEGVNAPDAKPFGQGAYDE